MVAKLTSKQQRFVAAYAGNATEAAIAAGYSRKTAAFIGAENLKKPQIAKAIREREAESMRPQIASREERQKFWTAIMRDEKQETRDRIKASESLGKSEGDFLDRHDLTSSDGSMSPKQPHSPAEVMAELLRHKRELDE